MKRLVLVGGGHAHAQFLADWIARPLPNVALTVVSTDARSPYSGMVPGWLAGLYDYDAICIDIAASCGRAGAAFVHDEMIGLDATQRRIALASGATVDYDLLSLDVGSTLHPPAVDGVVLPLRPLSRLRQRWDAQLAILRAGGGPTARASTIVAVGGGAAGFEAMLALHRQLGQAPARGRVRASVVTSSDRLLPALARGASRHAARVLSERGIALVTGKSFDPADVTSGQSRDDHPPIVLWATGAEAHRWQRTCGLAVDPAGFFRVDRTLRSISHADVFASGDCAAWSIPLPKAGVYAVRMGPILIHNLRAALTGAPLRDYRPQARHLVLLSTADRRAIVSWGPWSASGAWAWRWKDGIDRRFVARFRAPPSPPLATTSKAPR